MPIKELLIFATLSATWIALSNPLHPLQAIKAVERKILTEVRRTDNWGSPSIFQWQLHPLSKSSERAAWIVSQPTLSIKTKCASSGHCVGPLKREN